MPFFILFLLAYHFLLLTAINGFVFMLLHASKRAHDAKITSWLRQKVLLRPALMQLKLQGEVFISPALFVFLIPVLD